MKNYTYYTSFFFYFYFLRNDSGWFFSLELPGTLDWRDDPQWMDEGASTAGAQENLNSELHENTYMVLVRN